MLEAYVVPESMESMVHRSLVVGQHCHISILLASDSVPDGPIVPDRVCDLELVCAGSNLGWHLDTNFASSPTNIMPVIFYCRQLKRYHIQDWFDNLIECSPAIMHVLMKQRAIHKIVHTVHCCCTAFGEMLLILFLHFLVILGCWHV